jgi:hypothetical protein
LSLVLAVLMLASVMAGEFRVQYEYAGLTTIIVDDGPRLHYTWHTGRRPFDENDSSPMRQDLSAYDRHTSVVWLTADELQQFRQWAADYRALELKDKYPEPEVGTYGSAFKSTLTVILDDWSRTLTWNDDTAIPDSLRDAVDHLRRLSRQSLRNR